MTLPVGRDDLLRAVDERAPGGAPLDRLVAAIAVQGELAEVAAEVVRAAVADARAAGSSWARIGQALGVTKQAAQQRFAGRPAGEAGRRSVVDAVLVAAEAEARRAGRRQVEPADVLLALVPGPEGPADLGSAALAALGLELEPGALRARLGGPDDESGRPVRGRVRRSEASAGTVARAAELAASRAAGAADSGDLLVALVEVLGPQLDVPVERARDEVARLRRYGFADREVVVP